MYNPGSDHPPYYETAPPGTYLPQQGGYPPQPIGYPSAPIQQQPVHTTLNADTTVVIQQQPAAPIVQQPGRGWSTELLSCFDDIEVGLVGLGSCMSGLPIIECMVSGDAKECFCVGVYCPVALRTKIRMRHKIQGSILEDCCTLFFCRYCAMCQMARELKTHGI